MQEIIRMVSDHPLAAIGVAFALLLILYFLFMKLVKLALIMLLAAVAVGGYLYFQYPDERPANFKEAVEKIRTGAGDAVDKGKAAYDKGKDLVGKGKDLVDKSKSALDRGIDKGKDVIEGGKRTADKVGKFLGGDEKEP